MMMNDQRKPMASHTQILKHLIPVLVICTLIACTTSCTSNIDRQGERSVLLQPVLEGDSVLSNVIVTVRCDGENLVIPFNREFHGYRVPVSAFRNNGRCFTVEYGTYTFSEIRIRQRTEAILEGQNDVSRVLKLHMIRPPEQISIPLSDDRTFAGLTVPNGLHVSGFSEKSELDKIVADLERTCNVIAERVQMAGQNSAVIHLDRGIRKNDSPILRYLRSRSPQLRVSMIAESSENGWPYRYSNSLAVEFGVSTDTTKDILKEYRLTFLEGDGETVRAAADPGVGEGILDIVRSLNERVEVRSVSVDMGDSPVLYTSLYHCEIAVVNERNQPLPDASVVLIPFDGRGSSVQAGYHPASLRFIATTQTQYIDIVVSHEGLETQVRRADLRNTDLPISFLMAEPGASYTYMNGIQLQYTSRPEKLAIFMKSGSTAQDGQEIRVIANRYGADISDGLFAIGRGDNDVISGQRERPLLFTRTTHEERSKPDSIRVLNRGRLLRTLREHPDVFVAGPIFRMYDGIPSVFTNEATLEFFRDVPDTEAVALLKEAGFLEVERVSSYYRATGPLEWDEQINKRLEELLETGRVSSVSASVTVVPRIR